MEKVGIIIPAYNVEGYIYRAIESCINQTYTNIEVIVVDDGSKDDTYKVAKEYLKKDSRIRVYSQSNLGVSKARNSALQYCKTDYVLFLDSDDWLEKNAVEKLIHHISGNNNELIAADAYYAYLQGGKISRKKAPDIVDAVQLNSENALLYIAQKQYKLRSACYKLFSMKVIRDNHLCFNEHIRHGEDGLFVFEYLKCVDYFVYYPDLLWNILEREGSATQSPYNRTWLTSIDAVNKMMSYKNTSRLTKQLEKYKIERMVSILCHAVLCMPETKEDIIMLRKKLRKKNSWYIINEKNVKKRLFYLFASYMPIKIVSTYCMRKEKK